MAEVYIRKHRLIKKNVVEEIAVTEEIPKFNAAIFEWAGIGQISRLIDAGAICGTWNKSKGFESTTYRRGIESFEVFLEHCTEGLNKRSMGSLRVRKGPGEKIEGRWCSLNEGLSVEGI